ncbi:MAG: cysteine synthase A [Bacteroidales bacterium]|nr:cysteine synthase A [Bacteroidales bacterium]
MKVAKDITGLIGNTPLIRLNKMSEASGAELLAKLECQNPGGSVKDRLAWAMIRDAEEKGSINKDTIIIEPTSGNTGVGLAMVCASRNYKLILTMPESASMERRQIMHAYGAELVLTSGDEGMKGAIAKAQELNEKNPNSFIPQQFQNYANVEMHYETTGPEIWNDTDGKVDFFVAGVGTGGTITGAGKFLRQKNPNIKVVAVEPKDSPVLSGGDPGKHKIAGIGAGFIPDILNRDIIDEIITVATEDAFSKARQMAADEGVFSGISSGAIAWAAEQVARRPENKGKNIVLITCDTGERYLSTSLFAME